MIVVDASLIVEALTNPFSPSGERMAKASTALSPAHVDAEVGHALRGLVRGGLLADDEAERCLDDFGLSRVARAPLPPLLGRAFELRQNMSFYDALYVSLAELHELPLVTTDSKLARVPGLRCSIEVVPSP